MTINEYLEKFAKGRVIPVLKLLGRPHILPYNRPAVVCADGFNVSIQASDCHYCEPRITQVRLDDGSWGVNLGFMGIVNGCTHDGKAFVPYTQVECGFPSEEVEDWLEYSEDPDDPINTVYGYVPVELVDAALEAHGGIDIQKTEEEWRKHVEEMRNNGVDRNVIFEYDDYIAFNNLFKNLKEEQHNG